MKLEFSPQIFEKALMWNLIKIRPVEPSYSMRTDGLPDWFGKANGRFSNFCERA
jgi:hypothetical protein